MSTRMMQTCDTDIIHVTTLDNDTSMLATENFYQAVHKTAMIV